MKKITDVFEVEVDVGSMGYAPLLSVEATFGLTKDGPEQMVLNLIVEVAPAEAEQTSSLVFTMNEIALIRFAVADAIERKYWAGEYGGQSDFDAYRTEAPIISSKF